VRRSFSVEAKRCEKLSKFFFRFEAKKAVFSFVSLRSETLKITSETKASEAKKTKRNVIDPKNCQNKSHKKLKI
jgi:hypothetical protein